MKREAPKQLSSSALETMLQFGPQHRGLAAPSLCLWRAADAALRVQVMTRSCMAPVLLLPSCRSSSGAMPGHQSGSRSPPFDHCYYPEGNIWRITNRLLSGVNGPDVEAPMLTGCILASSQPRGSAESCFELLFPWIRVQYRVSSGKTAPTRRPSDSRPSRRCH